LQTLTRPDFKEEYHKGNLAITETRHCFNLGSFSVTRPLGASGPERATTFAPTRISTAVAGTARPFTIVSVATGRGASRSPAERRLRGGPVGAGEEIGAAEG